MSNKNISESDGPQDRPIVERTGVSPFDGKTPTYRIRGHRPPVGMISCGALVDGIYCGDEEAIDNNEGLTPHCDVWRDTNGCPRDSKKVR